MWCVWYRCKEALKDGQFWAHFLQKHVLATVDPLEPLTERKDLQWMVVAAFLSKDYKWTFRTRVVKNQNGAKVCTSRDQPTELKHKWGSWRFITDRRIEKAGLVTHDVEIFRTDDDDVFLERLVNLACLAYKRRADDLKTLWKACETIQLAVAQRSISVTEREKNVHMVSINIAQLLISPQSLVLYKVLIGDKEYLIGNPEVTQATAAESMTLPLADCVPVPEPPQKRQRV
jgi:hypothetical protein